jgi:2-haloacid dehalogenase
MTDDDSFRPRYVSFDCYGTLIHYQIADVTRSLLAGRLTESETERFLRQFSKYRYDQVCGTFYAYEQVLHDAYARTCARWALEVDDDAGQRLAAAVLTWGPHDDIPAPLKKLGDNYPLVILSNADTKYLDTSVPKLGADFHAVYTAEQAGVYKPRYQAFEYMLDQLSATPEEMLHVSSHTRYDLMPADDLGFTHKIFLDRGYDPQSPAYNYQTVASLDELNGLLGL